MIRRLVIPTALSFFVVLTQVGIVEHGFAQANYYEGKTVRFIVGFSAGGGYDAYTRTIARHMGKHVPGSPVFVVDNMAGGGRLVAGKFIFKAAQPGGPAIRHFFL